jgi:hypothetical protein
MSQYGRIIDKSSHGLSEPQMSSSSSRGTIYLLGDGILDNFYYLTDKTKDLQHEISSKGYRVVNYAVEESKLKDIIHGIDPKDIYKSSRPYPYLLDKDGKVYPLQLLANATKVNRSFTSAYGTISSFGLKMEEPETNTVVLSIGGKDIGTAPSTNILLGVEYYVNAVMTKEYLESLESVIENILRRCDRIILTSIYAPYMGSGAIYAIYSKVVIPVITKWRRGLEKIARKYNLPIIDLGRTINNRNKDHYGTSDIHLSEFANSCLVQCIEFICENYNGYGVYYAPDCDITKLTRDNLEETST